MRGGLEWLYEQATEDAITREDYLKRIMEIVNQYSEDFAFAQMSSELFE